MQTQFYDGWIPRFANGYTNRANSVNPLYPSTLDLEEKIAVDIEILAWNDAGRAFWESLNFKHRGVYMRYERKKGIT